tara:strand:+ start:68142 stop:68309 length:168 start_codon:yes stop_codon:yes gene_type:complete
MSKQAIFEEMKGLWTSFEDEHNKPTKSSDAKARKAIGEIKKLVTSYRKESVDSNK